MKKNIMSIFSILFIVLFILWASGCHLWEASALLDEPKGLEGCFRGSAIKSNWEMRTNIEQMRQYMEERTGQSFEGWTLYEMQLMEMELDRLEKEKREAAKQEGSIEVSQESTGQETSQSQSAQEPYYEDEVKSDTARIEEPYHEEDTAETVKEQTIFSGGSGSLPKRDWIGPLTYNISAVELGKLHDNSRENSHFYHQGKFNPGTTIDVYGTAENVALELAGSSNYADGKMGLRAYVLYYKDGQSKEHMAADTGWISLSPGSSYNYSISAPIPVSVNTVVIKIDYMANWNYSSGNWFAANLYPPDQG